MRATDAAEPRVWHVFREAGDRLSQASCRSATADPRRPPRANYDRAGSLVEEVLAHRPGVGSRRLVALGRYDLAAVALGQGHVASSGDML